MNTTTRGPRYLEAAIKEGSIYERGLDENPKIGVTLERYEELQAEHDELIEAFNQYQEKLLNLECPNCNHKYSAIPVQMTPEEQITALIEANQRQSQQINQLLDKVTQLLGASDNEEEPALPLERDPKGRFVASENKRNIRNNGNNSGGSE